MNKGITFIVGAAAGAVAALLLTPNTGEKNREILADKVDHCVANGDSIFHRAADNVRDRVHDAGQAAKPAADEVRDKINAARDRIAEQVTRNRGAQDVEADVSDVAEDIADDIADAAATA